MTQNPTQSRHWPFHGFAPGDYICKCARCDEEFSGDKRCITCAECAIRAYLASQEAPVPSEEPVGDFSVARDAVWRSLETVRQAALASPASPAVAPVAASITLNMAATSTEMQTLKPCEKHPARYCNCEGFYPACRSTDEVKP